jgi:hypothetical protein
VHIACMWKPEAELVMLAVQDKAGIWQTKFQMFQLEEASTRGFGISSRNCQR